jgi:hypothetical protein
MGVRQEKTKSLFAIHAKVMKSESQPYDDAPDMPEQEALLA